MHIEAYHPNVPEKALLFFMHGLSSCMHAMIYVYTHPGLSHVLSFSILYIFIMHDAGTINV